MIDDYPNVAAGFAYAAAIRNRTIDVCELVHLAIDRFYRDLDDAEAGRSPWEFRPDLAERPMTLAGLLPNIKGPKAGQLLELMAYQQFSYANIFGFVERGTDTRRFRQAQIWVPRGNGKTSGVAPIVLYMTFCAGEGGAEGYAAAVTRDQAKLLWDVVQAMVRQTPQFRQRFGVVAGEKSIYQAQTASKFIPISSDAKALDGLNVAVGVCDEIGSHKNASVYDVLLTALGKRRHPLLLGISTATGNNAGIGRTLWDYCIRVLRQLQDDDRMFALIYTIDDGDDPWSEASWIKANPGWGITVQPDAIRAIMKQARNNPATEATARTKHLNLWVGADDALFSGRAWADCRVPGLDLADMRGRRCHIGLDLASKVDLAAASIVFPEVGDDGRMIYTVFAQCWLNEQAVMEVRHAAYPGWSAAGWLALTPGNETDYAQIEAWILDQCAMFEVVSVAFDPWGAAMLTQRLVAENVPMVKFNQTVANLSDPTKETSAAMGAGRIRHNGNPVLQWCFGNVVGHYDTNGNVKPNKSRDLKQKNDAAIATIMGIGRAMLDDPNAGVSIYETSLIEALD